MAEEQTPTAISATGEPHSNAATSRRAWLTLVVVAGGLFLAVVSTTVVSVALPTIGRELHASATDLQWIVDAYVLVYASLLVAGGATGDRRGRKGLFVLGVAVFGLGSLLTGIAPSVGVLLIGRVVQGLGPALLVPGSLTIIRATFEDPRRRAVAIGLWSTASGLALAVGPALGGVIAGALGWRWVFLFNVPLTVVLIGLAARCIPRLPRTPVRHRFDWLGAILTTIAVAALCFATIEGQARGWSSPLILAAFAGGVASLVAFVVWERHVATTVQIPAGRPCTHDIILASHTSLTGIVRSAVTDRPLPEALVVLLDGDGAIAAAGYTGTDGRFCFRDLPADDSYTLTITGYPPSPSRRPWPQTPRTTSPCISALTRPMTATPARRPAPCPAHPPARGRYRDRDGAKHESCADNAALVDAA